MSITSDVNDTSSPRRFRLPFFGWWIVLGSALIHALQQSTFGFTFGVYLLQIQNGFGWSRFAISSAFSVSQMLNGLMGPVLGWLVDRFGSRVVMSLGIVLFGTAFMGLSTVSHLGTYFLFVLLIGAGASMSGFLTMNATLTNWFLRRRALAMGLGSTGIGLAGLLAPLVAWSVVAYGWRPTAFASGVAILLIGLPLAQLFRRQPEDYGLRPDGDALVHGQYAEAAEAPKIEASADFTVGEALRDRNFWFVSIGHGMALLVVFSITVHLVPHLVDGLGWSEVSAQSMFTLVTLTSVLGQVIGGFLGDRYSKTKVAAFCMFGHFSAMMLLAFGVSAIFVVLAAVVHGLSWGARGPLMMAIRADYYGRSHFATIAGFSTVVVMVGPLLGPAFAGAMSDIYGDYTMAFFILGMLTGAGSVFFFISCKPDAPPRIRQAFSKTDVSGHILGDRL